MWNLVLMYISRLLVLQWVLIVPHWWQICSYIHMTLILYIYKRASSRSRKTSFNITFRYIDDVLSLNKFNCYNDVIYPKELEIKTLQMLQNGLIIFTFIWRMVNFSHESMTNVMTLIFSLQSIFHT